MEQKGADETIFERYRAKLRAEGVAPAEVDRRIAILRERGSRLEIERWNRILTAGTPQFNTEPNAFLVEMIRGRQPGTALDVGMGQVRNAIYLAQQGWGVTGFDPADQAVAVARMQAAALGLRLATFVQTDDEFEFGTDRWDLIVLSYVRRAPESRPHPGIAQVRVQKEVASQPPLFFISSYLLLGESRIYTSIILL